ncbi:hypothetical protein DV515_00002758, partial [Chloebia gouldiae]
MQRLVRRAGNAPASEQGSGCAIPCAGKWHLGDQRSYPCVCANTTALFVHKLAVSDFLKLEILKAEKKNKRDLLVNKTSGRSDYQDVLSFCQWVVGSNTTLLNEAYPLDIDLSEKIFEISKNYRFFTTWCKKYVESNEDINLANVDMFPKATVTSISLNLLQHSLFPIYSQLLTKIILTVYLK